VKLSAWQFITLSLGAFLIVTATCLVLILTNHADAKILTVPFGGLLAAGCVAIGKRIGDAKGEFPDLFDGGEGQVTITKTHAPPPLRVPSAQELAHGRPRPPEPTIHVATYPEDDAEPTDANTPEAIAARAKGRL
jgi:hypothetical protein